MVDSTLNNSLPLFAICTFRLSRWARATVTLIMNMCCTLMRGKLPADETSILSMNRPVMSNLDRNAKNRMLFTTVLHSLQRFIILSRRGGDRRSYDSAYDNGVQGIKGTIEPDNDNIKLRLQITSVRNEFSLVIIGAS